MHTFAVYGKTMKISNNKIMLMVGDLGFSVVENFKEKYPKQFINANPG